MIKASGELEAFLTMYGTFFEEFKKDELSSWLFYVLFVIRRISITILVIFIDSPTIQLTLSIAFTLSVLSI